MIDREQLAQVAMSAYGGIEFFNHGDALTIADAVLAVVQPEIERIKCKLHEQVNASDHLRAQIAELRTALAAAPWTPEIGPVLARTEPQP